MDNKESFRMEYKHSFKNPVLSLSSLTVFRTGFQKCPKSYHRGTEIRDFYLIHYVIKGKGTLIEEGRPYPVEAGESFIIFPGIQIDYIADRDDPWEFCWVGFSGSDAKLLVSASGFSLSNPVLRHKDPQRVYDCLSKIYEARGNDNYDVVKMSAYLYLLFSVLVEDCPESTSGNGKEQLKNACEYIAGSYARNISVDDIAAAANISRSMLYRLFMEHLKTSPKAYLSEYRVKMACKLLAKTDMAVKEIAAGVGFPNPQHFAVVFRNSTGYTPTGYREAKRIGSSS